MVRLATDAMELHSCPHKEDDFEAALMEEDIFSPFHSELALVSSQYDNTSF